MIKAGSNLENRPFDVRCTLLHILYSDIVNVPVTDADASFCHLPSVKAYAHIHPNK